MKNTISEEEKRKINIIIDQWDGIFAPYEAFYIHSIIYTAECSIRCFGNFDRLVKENCSDADIFASAQEALTHAGALSRFFGLSKPMIFLPRREVFDFAKPSSSVIHRR